VIWIAYNGQERSGRWAAVIVEADDYENARQSAYGAFLDYARSKWNCETRARRFSVIESLEAYDGSLPSSALPAVALVGLDGRLEEL
jgi:hypothetical protein